MKLREDTAVRYQTKINDQIAGPYTLEGLESLVYLKRIDPDTLVAREGTGTFLPIRETELAPLLFKNLKAPSNAPHQWAPPGRENDPEFLNRTRLRLGEAKFERVADQRAPGRKVDVFELLDDIRQTEIDAGLDRIKPKRFRIDRRTKDFWIMLIVGNTVFIGGALCVPNTMSLVFGFAGSGLFTFGLLWSMYGVMDKY